MDVATAGDPAADLLSIYDRAVGDVHRYVARRCPAAEVEDLTSETFMAAVDSIQRGVVAEVTVAWLMGIARHKVVDHWRRVEREQRRLAAVEGELSDELDPWDPVIDQQHAEAVLAALRPNHRLVLTLKYRDGLPVAEIAQLLDRSANGIEALLTRAKAEFRSAYGEASP